MVSLDDCGGENAGDWQTCDPAAEPLGFMANYQRVRQVMRTAAPPPPPPPAPIIHQFALPRVVMDHAAAPLPLLPRPHPSWKVIIREMLDRHGFATLDELRINGRRMRPVRCKQEMFYRLYTETPLSFPNIAHRCGGYDHSTVLHGVKKHWERYVATIPGSLPPAATRIINMCKRGDHLCTDSSGKFFLEPSGVQARSDAARMIISLGLLTPSEDGLFPLFTQTYIWVDEASTTSSPSEEEGSDDQSPCPSD